MIDWTHYLVAAIAAAAAWIVRSRLAKDALAEARWEHQMAQRWLRESVEADRKWDGLRRQVFEPDARRRNA